MPDSHGSIDLGGMTTDDEKGFDPTDPASYEDPVVPPGPVEDQPATIFIVAITREGEISVAVPEAPMDRKPTGDDLISACAVITSDIQATKTSQQVQLALQQQMVLAQQASQDAQIKAQLGNLGNLRG